MTGVRTYRHLLVATLLLAVLCLLVPVAMRAAVSPFVYESIDNVPQAEVVIILGASVVAGKPSPILADRANAAIALYSAGKATKILVTGDNAALSHDEVTPVRKYLLDADIPAQDIFLDHAGFDTYSSIYRAQAVFKVQAAIIVTQDFHLPRALWIARRLGLEAYGVTAEGGTSSTHNYLREIPASLKAILDTLAHREPKSLGPAIPLSGDGQATWY